MNNSIYLGGKCHYVINHRSQRLNHRYARITSRHCRTGLLRAAFGNDTIKFIQVRVEIEYYKIRSPIFKNPNCEQRLYSLLTATHSIMSTYFGNITIVLKLPLTRADSTKGLHKYKGLFGAGEIDGEGGIGGGGISGGNVVDVGVGDRFGPRGARLMERLDGNQANG